MGGGKYPGGIQTEAPSGTKVPLIDQYGQKTSFQSFEGQRKRPRKDLLRDLFEDSPTLAAYNFQVSIKQLKEFWSFRWICKRFSMVRK